MAGLKYGYQIGPKYREAWNQNEAALAEGLTAAMGDAGTELKEVLRDQVRSAGLGDRLANTWQGKVFPQGRNSLDPSAYVWSKAPRIILAFGQGATIVPVNGSQRLAIPTENVPRNGRRLMTPVEVEAAFNQDLIVRPGRKGSLLAFVNVIPALNKRGFRKATPRRLASGRDVKLVLMFVLVRSVFLAKRFDIQAAAEKVGARVPEFLANRMR